LIKLVAVEHDRVIAITIDTDDGNTMLLINVYMPNDTHSRSELSEEFVEVCNVIESLICRTKYIYIVIGGDMNVDFRRNNMHTNYTQDLLQRNSMCKIWNTNGFPEYTHSGPTGTSCIDHFLSLLIYWS
jgi:exonuclease III